MFLFQMNILKMEGVEIVIQLVKSAVDQMNGTVCLVLVLCCCKDQGNTVSYLKKYLWFG